MCQDMCYCLVRHCLDKIRVDFTCSKMSTDNCEAVANCHRGNNEKREKLVPVLSDCRACNLQNCPMLYLSSVSYIIRNWHLPHTQLLNQLPKIGFLVEKQVAEASRSPFSVSFLVVSPSVPPLWPGFLSWAHVTNSFSA